MQPKFAALPFSIYFNLNEERHTVSVSKKWGGKSNNIHQSVQAVIDTEEHIAKARLLEDVRAYIATFPDVQDGLIRVSDFTLAYTVNPIEKDGRFWSGEGPRQHVNL